MSKTSQIEVINQEINRQLANAEVGRALLATTFKGLTAVTMKQAIMEGMIRGFRFEDFLKKNVYAIPFRDRQNNRDSYSLITSIDYARKIGAKSGIVGKDAPKYEMDGKHIVSCSVTVHKKTGNYIGDFTAEVYFDEFDTGKNLWVSKPRVMIAKVAEMHALRSACPEELSQLYAEEELESEKVEPMKPYTVARVIPAEDDEAGGYHADPEVPKADEPVNEPVAEVVPEEPAVEEKPRDVKVMKKEIADLLYKKAKFTSLGKTQDKISDKIFDLVGIAYREENYPAIIEELQSL